MSDLPEPLYPEALQCVPRMSREELRAQLQATPALRDQFLALKRASASTATDAAVAALGALLAFPAISTIQQGYRTLQSELDKVRAQRFHERIIDELAGLAERSEEFEERLCDLHELFQNDRGNLIAAQAEREAALATHPISIDALAEAVARIALRGPPDEEVFEDDCYFVWLIARLTPQEIRVFRIMPFVARSEFRVHGKSPQEPDGQRLALAGLAQLVAAEFPGVARETSPRIEAALLTLHQRMLIRAYYDHAGKMTIGLTAEGLKLRTYLAAR